MVKYTELQLFFASKLDKMYDMTKKELQKPNLFEIDRKNFFKGFSLVINGTDVFEDIHHTQFYYTWLPTCIFFRVKLMLEDEKEQKKILCSFMRLILLQPIFVEGPFVERPTPSTGSKCMLTESLKSVVPSNYSSAIDEEKIMKEFSKLERKLVKKWMRNCNFYDLLTLYTTSINDLSSSLVKTSGSKTEQSIQRKIENTLGDIVTALLRAAEPGFHKNSIEESINQPVFCPSYETAERIEVLENTVSSSGTCYKVNRGAMKRQVTLHAKIPSINNLLDFEYCTKIDKYKDIFKEVIGRAIASSSFPIQINDGQQYIYLALPDQDILKCEVDKHGNIRVNFRIFNIKRIDTSNDSILSDTPITPQMILMLSLSTDVFKGIGTDVLVQNIVKDPETIYQIYIDLLEKGKNISTSDPDIFPSFSSSSSRSSQEKEIDDLKSSIGKNLKRYVIYKRLPVIKKLTENAGTVTLVLSSKSVSELLNLELPSTSEKFVMKVNHLDFIEPFFDKYRYKDLHPALLTFEKYLGAVYHKEFLHEVAINVYLDRYNEDSTEGYRIRKPKILHAGEILSPNYRGFFYIQEYLPFMDNKPTSEVHVEDGLSQLSLLNNIHIKHGDVKTKNLCIKEDKIWLVDFGNSQVMSTNSEANDDIRYMKKILNSQL